MAENRTLADRLAHFDLAPTRHLAHEERAAGIDVMLNDLHCLADIDGCVAAAWAFELLATIGTKGRSMSNDTMPCGHDISQKSVTVESKTEFCEVCLRDELFRDAAFMEKLLSAQLAALTAERDALAATLQAIRELCEGYQGKDLSPQNILAHSVLAIIEGNTSR